MKRFLVVLIALLTMAAFVSVSDAAAKKAKVLKAKGIVTAYDATAEKPAIEIQPAKGDPMTFAVTGDTKVTGEVAKDAKVTVTYTKAADGTMTATAIQVTPPAKKKK
ncbi:MAG: hypothetical protein H8D67_19870 [Deltaproteobacteria bacterium]|nr:hypothetical protein [Deltaproteobacteria bacterium]